MLTRPRILVGALALAVSGVVATAGSPKPVMLVPQPAPSPQVIQAPAAAAPLMQLTESMPTAVQASATSYNIASEPVIRLQQETETNRLSPPVVLVAAPVKVPVVKVALLIGEGRSKFEVACDESVMRVTCDNVVASAANESGKTHVKGHGNVTFALPGWSGSCDEIQVLTQSGEIIVNGHVKLAGKSSKIVTEVQGTTVRFKFGAVPLADVIEPGSFSPDSMPR